jgi:hypothetical protein
MTQYGESVHGKWADRILLSPCYNLETPRSTPMRARLSALSQRAMPGDGDAARASCERSVMGWVDTQPMTPLRPSLGEGMIRSR